MVVVAAFRLLFSVPEKPSQATTPVSSHHSNLLPHITFSETHPDPPPAFGNETFLGVSHACSPSKFPTLDQNSSIDYSVFPMWLQVHQDYGIIPCALWYLSCLQ